MSAGAAASTLPADAVRLGLRRVYILPTRHGVAFAAVLLVMLIGAVNYNNSLGYLLTFLLAAAALVGMLHTWRNLYGLRVTPGQAQRVFAGGHAVLPVLLENPEPTPRPALMAYLAAASEASLPAVVGRLAAGSQTVLPLEAPAKRRGRLPLGDVIVSSRWPLGLFRAWTVLPSERECLVCPRPLGRRELPASSIAADHPGGRSGAGNEDFAGFRAYHPGDSPRHIHWKAVARGQGVPVKLFAGSGAAELALRFAATPAGDLETRLSQLCLWVLEAHARGVRYALELPGENLPPAHGEAHRERCLRALALYGGQR